MRVLFLCMNMNGFHGSALHVFEYAEYFVKKGAEVSIASVFIADENATLAEKLGARLYSLRDLPKDAEYDLVFALHLFLFPYMILRGLHYKHVITMTLSAFIPLEMVPPAQLWTHFDLMTCISDEIIEMYQSRFGIHPKYFTKIPNHIPLRFYEHINTKRSWNTTIKKICVVSNRYIPEAGALKKDAPFEVDYFGMEYNNSILITPDILLKYDVIMTIGKTVQYGLALGIPVFEYDRFGGCGYISLENMDREERMNFSGRATREKMTSEALILRLQAGYAVACAEASELRNRAFDRYAIHKLIEKQLALLPRESAHRAFTRDGLLFLNAAAAAIDAMHLAMDGMAGKA